MRIGGDRHSEGGRERVHRVVAPDAGEVEHFGAAPAFRRCESAMREEALTVTFTEQREHEITARVHVVRDDQQLAEGGLTEVLAEQLDEAAAKFAPRRRRKRGGAAYQVRQHGGRAIQDQ